MISLAERARRHNFVRELEMLPVHARCEVCFGPCTSLNAWAHAVLVPMPRKMITCTSAYCMSRATSG